jgi:hypothetical protein
VHGFQFSSTATRLIFNCGNNLMLALIMMSLINNMWYNTMFSDLPGFHIHRGSQVKKCII